MTLRLPIVALNGLIQGPAMTPIQSTTISVDHKRIWSSKRIDVVCHQKLPLEIPEVKAIVKQGQTETVIVGIKLTFSVRSHDKLIRAVCGRPS